MARAPKKKTVSQKSQRRARGFLQTGGILHQSIRKATEKRGFVETRLLTHWAEIVGTATAGITRPVKVGYGREGMGATLTLLVTGANAPMVQADLPKIKDRVNACYGYAAISRIRLTQTAATGFGEDAPSFKAKGPEPKPDPSRAQIEAVNETVTGVEDENLRQALENLGQNIITRDN